VKNLLVRVVLSILLLALTTEAIDLVGDLLSTASDVAVVVGLLLFAVGMYVSMKTWMIIWRKR
jgi:hypothetical protein